MSHINAVLSGFTVSLSLIVAIGAQNAFVLKQGLLKQYVPLLVFICATSDMILIGLGVAGFGTLVTQFPLIEIIARYGGAAFLVAYGIVSLISAVKRSHALSATATVPASKKKVVLTCLAFTWLNPHVYLDTVFLVGSISTQFPDHKLAFFVGAASASYFFFILLGYGAGHLQHFFRSPTTWKWLDTAIGVLMLTIAYSLVA